MSTATLAEKVCTKCNVEQPIAEFQADPRYADGYAGWCRGCRNAKARASYHRHREKNVERMRAARVADPERQRGYAQTYREKHLDECLERSRRHYAENPEKYAAWHRSWRERNREHRNAYMRAYFVRRIAADPEFAARIAALSRQTTRTRDARKRGQFVEHVDPRVVWMRDEGICGICDSPVETAAEFEVDHIIPLVQGGEHSYANTQVAHALCNRRKGGCFQ